MKIAIVRSPWWVRYCPPYILAFFSTLLRQNGHEVYPFDLNNILYHKVEEEYRKYFDDRDYYSFWEDSAFAETILSASSASDCICRILNTGAEIICFTTHTPNSMISMEIARRIKDADSSRIIVFMGHKCSRAQMAYDFAECEHIDYVCTGESDIALVELISELEKGEVAPDVKGLLYKYQGKIVDLGMPDTVADLDSLPFPDYSDFMEGPNALSYSQSDRLDILDSRGCVNACHFCYERLYWGKYRTMSAEKIYEQILFHKDMLPDKKFFYFNGLLLNGKLDVLEEFCDLAINNCLSVRWSGQAMIDRRMDRALFKKMKDAGCDWLYFGVESGSDRVLEAMNKKHRAADTLSVLRAAKESGIKAQANFMFGYPAERKEDHELTLRHLEKIRPYIESILASQSFCTLEKKTVMSERFADFGIADGSHHLYWSSLDGRNNYMERFRRYEEFCRLAIELGFPEGSGVFYEKPDKGILIGDYHMYKGEFAEAAVAYRRFMEKYGAKPDILRKEAAAYEMSGDKDKALKVYSDALDMYRDSSVTTSGIETLKKKIEELK